MSLNVPIPPIVVDKSAIISLNVLSVTASFKAILLGWPLFVDYIDLLN